VSAATETLHLQTDRASSRNRPAVLLLVFAIHAVILLIALRAVTRVPLLREQPLVFLALPAPAQTPQTAAVPAPTMPAPPHKKPAASRDSQLVAIPAPPPPEQPPATIDWNSEAAMAIEQQARSAMAAPPRALDKHGKGADLNGGLGPDHKSKPEFGWDRSHTHRVESLEGGGIVIALNDRCVLVLLPLPLGGCGIGKIPVRGDLFDHMYDAPQAGGISKNTAP
jgi:hypothetical protein